MMYLTNLTLAIWTVQYWHKMRCAPDIVYCWHVTALGNGLVSDCNILLISLCAPAILSVVYGSFVTDT